MRLVFTVTNDLSYDQRMQRICRTLSQAGYDVTLVGFLRPGSKPLPAQPYRQERLSLRYTRGKLFYLEYNWRLYRLLRRLRPDGIGSIDLDTLTAGFFAARALRVPLIFDAHEYYSELPEVVSRPWVHRFWSTLEGWLCPRVAHNYTVSESVGHALQERYGQPYAVFPNYPRLRQDGAGAEAGAGAVSGERPCGSGQPFGTGQPAALQPSLPGSGQPFVLYQGALNLGRGLEAAIESFQTLPLPLFVAGEGDLSAELREHARNQLQPDQTRFLGYVEPAALRALTAQAWLGLNLLEDQGLSYRYSLSNKFFDYVQACVPQIAMDFPEYRRLNALHEVAVLVPDARPETVHAAVTALLQDPERYERLRSACCQAREAWVWEALEGELLAFYARVFNAAAPFPPKNRTQNTSPS
jgi:glycosyltransferase involved in cell wall biosynthesis